MLTKNKIKFIKSLQQKKHRTEAGSFVVEGRKGIEALIDSQFEVEELYITDQLKAKMPSLEALDYVIADIASIERASGLKSNIEGIAIVKQRKARRANFTGVSLYLDGVSDPGNLGTIIRTADWFGITEIVYSEECVDFYNPKVIQSTMGSFVKYLPVILTPEAFMKRKPEDFSVFVTAFDGESPKLLSGVEKGVVVMGSESHGVSDYWLKRAFRKVTIPFVEGKSAESLNVGVAASILCYQIKQG